MRQIHRHLLALGAPTSGRPVAPLLLLAVLSLAVLQPFPALAETNNRDSADPVVAAGFIQGFSERVSAILAAERDRPEERRAQLSAELEKGFNARYVALLVIGPNRRHLSEDELEDYERLFSAFMVSRYVGLLEAQAGRPFRIAGAGPTGARDATVKMEIEDASGGSILVEWRVRMFSGEPKIIDVAFEGLSLADHQRTEFNEIIAVSGVDGLIAALKSGAEILGDDEPV